MWGCKRCKTVSSCCHKLFCVSWRPPLLRPPCRPRTRSPLLIPSFFGLRVFCREENVPPPPDFLVCSVLPLSSREARGLFVILAVGPKQLMGGLRKNSLWRWRSMASEDQNHFAPASSQVWPFFSNPLGLDFMAEPLQLLPCLCCHLWTHCSTDSSKCMSNLFWGKKQQK